MFRRRCNRQRRTVGTVDAREDGIFAGREAQLRPLLPNASTNGLLRPGAGPMARFVRMPETSGNVLGAEAGAGGPGSGAGAGRVAAMIDAVKNVAMAMPMIFTPRRTVR